MLKKQITTLTLLFAVGQLLSQSFGGTTSGAAIFCDSINSGFISLTNYTGSIVKWQSNSAGSGGWQDISNITSTQSYNKLKQSTGFRAIVKNGSFPSDTSTVCTITVQLKGSTGILSAGGTFCHESGPGAISLTGYAGNVLKWEYSQDNGMLWLPITNTASSLSYTNIVQSTMYRVIVQTMTSCPIDTTSSAIFTIHKKTKAGSIFGADSVCSGFKGDTLKLRGYTGTILAWHASANNGQDWTSLNGSDSQWVYPKVTKSILYRAIVKNGVCNTETTTPAIVGVYPINPAYAGEDQVIVQYETITLNGRGKGQPSWNPALSLDNPAILNPQAKPIITTDYVLTLSDTHMCLTFDTVNIKVIIPVPTVITPNGDGVNDFFIIDKIDDYPGNSLSIFNRWGALVYKKSPYKNDWNGKADNGQDLPDEIYFQVLDYGNGEKPLTNYILIKR